MNREELEKIRKPLNPAFQDIFVNHSEEDEYGYYATGLYQYHGKSVFVNYEEGAWHLSVSAGRTLGYYELKIIRYEFLPNRCQMAQIFPPREEFVNLHPNCFHLYEIGNEEQHKGESILIEMRRRWIDNDHVEGPHMFMLFALMASNKLPIKKICRMYHTTERGAWIVQMRGEEEYVKAGGDLGLLPRLAGYFL